MVNQYHAETKKKRKPWIIQEDKLLKKLVKKFQNERLAWKKISQTLKQHGFNRDTKACRERFSNHLDNSYNKTDLTDGEIDQLFDLIEVYGNKWTYIAEQLNNRTDQDIKNKFYAHVKKIIRRLIKAAYKTTESSIIIAKIQPLLISSIYCHDDEENDKILRIDDEMKILFKYLIRNNKKIEVGVKVDDSTIDKVKIIMNYLGEQNDIYIKKKINKQAQKVQLKKLKQKRNLKVQLGLNKQQRIIDKIQKRQPIFTTKNVKIEKFLFSQNPVQKEQMSMPCFDFKSLENMYSFQPFINPIITTASFYWRQPSNLFSMDPMLSNNFLFSYQGNQNQYRLWSEKYKVTPD
ncbi:unnamed protein product [Paramecium sonneborni]|uniref:Myb-like DNA-binding domain-containing protein n=1 Tax=Paramecium sonneborni TaxID=65129 RepID=A0A8S1QAW4_9CILI|nr:unnamed protein product [Paramecium sonneborni]